MGFGVPLDYWFRDSLREMTRETLLAPDARCHQYFRADTISQLLNEHTQRVFDHAPRLWALLFLELWLRRWVG
jgi:asparagine synthase (glutamine-hydrolysing)